MLKGCISILICDRDIKCQSIYREAFRTECVFVFMVGRRERVNRKKDRETDIDYKFRNMVSNIGFATLNCIYLT